MHDDQLRDLLGRATAGAPDEDLTQVAWDAGLRRARRQQWTVGWLGAVAGVAAIVGAWSLGGGSTGASPGPADGGGVDDMAVTSTPPGQELVPYRVVFEVIEGEARPDGPVEEWADVAGVTLQATEVTVRTDDGVVSAEYPVTPLVLGGPVTLRADGSASSEAECGTVQYAGGSVGTDGRVRLELRGPANVPEDGCSHRGGTGPADLLTGMHGTMTGSDLRQVGTEATLRWEDGLLVATGKVMHDVALPEAYTDEGPGQRTVLLAEVPQSELESMEDFPGSAGVEPAPGTPESVVGEWHVLDLRGVEPATAEGPTLSFDGESWTVRACGEELSADGSLIDGTIAVTGTWSTSTVQEESPCPALPWQDLETWRQLLEAQPAIVVHGEGTYRGLMILGDLP